MSKKYEDYYNPEIKKQIEQAEADYKATADKNNINTSQYIKSVADSYNGLIANEEKKTDDEIKAIPQQMQSAYDAAEVNAALTRRQIAESMANTGQSNSGLNRTEAAGVQIAKQNQMGALDQQQTTGVQSLKRPLADMKASLESEQLKSAADAQYNTAQQNSSLYSQLRQQARANATTGANAAYTADVEAEVAQYKAQQDALLEQYKAEVAADAKIKAAQISAAASTAKASAASTKASAASTSSDIDDIKDVLKSYKPDEKGNYTDEQKKRMFKYLDTIDLEDATEDDIKAYEKAVKSALSAKKINWDEYLYYSVNGELTKIPDMEQAWARRRTN